MSSTYNFFNKHAWLYNVYSIPCTCMYTQILHELCAHACTCAHTHTHTLTHARTRTHTHTHIHMQEYGIPWWVVPKGKLNSFYEQGVFTAGHYACNYIYLKTFIETFDKKNFPHIIGESFFEYLHAFIHN